MLTVRAAAGSGCGYLVALRVMAAQASHDPHTPGLTAALGTLDQSVADHITASPRQPSPLRHSGL